MPDWQTRITVDPNVMVGKPVIRGTRIPIEVIVRMLGQGISEEEILTDYPRLQSEDIRTALTYAASVLARRDFRYPVDFAKVVYFGDSNVGDSKALQHWQMPTKGLA